MSNFTVEIISPAKSILKIEAREVILPSFEGEIGILKDHIPIITFLRPGIIKILSDANHEFFVEDGTVEFVNDNLLILTSTARKLSDLKKENLNSIITETEKAINKDPLKDKEKYLLTYKLETLKNIIQ